MTLPSFNVRFQAIKTYNPRDSIQEESREIQLWKNLNPLEVIEIEAKARNKDLFRGK